MSELASNYQLTLPRAVALDAGLKPGDEIDCEVAGDIIGIRSKVRTRDPGRTITERLMMFDLTSERQQHSEHSKILARAAERGWTRDDLYERRRGSQSSRFGYRLKRLSGLLPRPPGDALLRSPTCAGRCALP